MVTKRRPKTTKRHQNVTENREKERERERESERERERERVRVSHLPSYAPPPLRHVGLLENDFVTSAVSLSHTSFHRKSLRQWVVQSRWSPISIWFGTEAKASRELRCPNGDLGSNALAISNRCDFKCVSTLTLTDFVAIWWWFRWCSAFAKNIP